MERVCVVNGCAGFGRLYRFPKEECKSVEWKQNLNFPLDYKVTRRSCVCAKHFEKSRIGYKKLIKNSLPTLFLGHSETVKENSTTQTTHLKRRWCCIENCDGNSLNRKLHRFPDEPRRTLWINACNVSEHKNKYVCRQHFDISACRKSKLSNTAVPTLFLNKQLKENMIKQETNSYDTCVAFDSQSKEL